jgi:phenylpropionate dioxygenase-like ring-hydroxylating dioxygenase large terminal subunit|tara:strand:+ start:546 stop:1565 length:1020 start_codon:yes stop_codon:yes gene_type:complete
MKKTLNNLKKNSWIIACHKNEIQKNNDFKTLEYFNEPVIIYNIKNKYLAFKNVCPHRGSKIKTENRGNQVLNCIYHGWAFNKEGKLISGPNLNEAFSKKQIKNISLDKMKIENCGLFIFITNINNKITLKDYLGDHYTKIEDLSKNYGKLVYSNKYTWKCNWKIAIENSIDEYHGPILHKGTFSKILKLDPSYTYSKKISEMEMPLKTNYISFFKKYLKENKIKLNDKYKHTYIYPISTIASTMGIFCYIQKYLPVDKNKTLIETDIFIPSINSKNKFISNTFLKNSAVKFNDEVFLEDKEICENLNKNIVKGFKRSILGKFEQRIKFFRKILKDNKIE